MRWTAGAWVPSVLAMLQVAGLGLPCTFPGPGDAGMHSGSAHAVDSGPVDVPGRAQAALPDSEPIAPSMTAACPCGCTGGSALAAPARNLGDALLLDEWGPAPIRAGFPVPLASIPEPAAPAHDIDHVPLQLG